MRYNMDHGGVFMEKTATLSLRVSPGDWWKINFPLVER